MADMPVTIPGVSIQTVDTLNLHLHLADAEVLATLKEIQMTLEELQTQVAAARAAAEASKTAAEKAQADAASANDAANALITKSQQVFDALQALKLNAQNGVLVTADQLAAIQTDLQATIDAAGAATTASTAVSGLEATEGQALTDQAGSINP